MDKPLDELTTAAKKYSNSVAGKAEIAQQKAAEAKAAKEKAAAEAKEAREKAAAEVAERQFRTVKVHVDGEAIEKAIRAAVCKMTGASEEDIEAFQMLGRAPAFSVRLNTKEAATKAKEAAPMGGDGYTLKGKEATGAIRVTGVKPVPVPSHSIYFPNPIAIPRRPKPAAEGDDAAAAAAAATEAEADASADASAEKEEAAEDVDPDAFKQELCKKVSDLFVGGAEGEHVVVNCALMGGNFVVTFESRASVDKALSGFFEPLMVRQSKLGPVRRGVGPSKRPAQKKRPAQQPKKQQPQSKRQRGGGNQPQQQRRRPQQQQRRPQQQQRGGGRPQKRRRR